MIGIKIENKRLHVAKEKCKLSFSFFVIAPILHFLFEILNDFQKKNPNFAVPLRS